MPTINDILTRLTQAWNDGDAAAYAANFTPDATYVVFDGTILTGRTAIEDTHRFLFAGPLRGSRLDGSGTTSFRTVRPDVAHVVVQGGVDDRVSVISLLLVADRDDDWLISAFQNTRRGA